MRTDACLWREASHSAGAKVATERKHKHCQAFCCTRPGKKSRRSTKETSKPHERISADIYVPLISQAILHVEVTASEAARREGRKQWVRVLSSVCALRTWLQPRDHSSAQGNLPSHAAQGTPTHSDPLDFITDSRLPPFCIPRPWSRRY